jgi:hypothetical protein
MKAAMAMQQLLTDATLQERFRQNGLVKSKRFASQDIVTQYERLYEQVVTS